MHNATPERLMAEIRHFATEALALRYSTRFDQRREMVDSICSRLAQLPAVDYNYPPDDQMGQSRVLVKFLHHGKVEEVMAPRNLPEMHHRYGKVVVRNLRDWGNPGALLEMPEGKKYTLEGALTLLLSVLENPYTVPVTEAEYLDAMRSMWDLWKGEVQ